jgi:hypothetical protein
MLSKNEPTTLIKKNNHHNIFISIGIVAVAIVLIASFAQGRSENNSLSSRNTAAREPGLHRVDEIRIGLTMDEVRNILYDGESIFAQDSIFPGLFHSIWWMSGTEVDFVRGNTFFTMRDEEYRLTRFQFDHVRYGHSTIIADGG